MFYIVRAEQRFAKEGSQIYILSNMKWRKLLLLKGLLERILSSRAKLVTCTDVNFTHRGLLRKHRQQHVSNIRIIAFAQTGNNSTRLRLNTPKGSIKMDQALEEDNKVKRPNSIVMRE